MENQTNTKWWIIGSVGALAFIALLFWVFPVYNVWSSAEGGKASLSHADFERQVQIVNAQANLQAEMYNASSEVIRAQGVAQANLLVKDSISDEYVKYLWVKTLDQTQNQIIYVPLGADGLPVTEAGRAVK